MSAAPLFERDAAGATLEAAREHAGLTHGELAARVGTTALAVEDYETGLWAVRAAYVADVLRACGLPEGWRRPEPGES